jgi:hypothetical protein
VRIGPPTDGATGSRTALSVTTSVVSAAAPDPPTAGALPEIDVDAHDVGVSGREGEHPLPAASDDQWRAGLLDRSRMECVLVDVVVGAVEGERAVGA